MTPQDIITDARYVMNDTDSSAYRQSNTELLAYVNDAIKEASGLNPMLFSAIGDMTCTSGQCEQAITFADASMLLDVLSIHEGNALTRFDRMTMDQFNTGWRSDTAEAAQQWAPVENDPLKFWVYPAAPADQVLDVRYVKIPTELALTDTVGDLPASYLPALSAYVCYRAEMKDDEHVLSQRAQAAYQAFRAAFGGK